MMKETTCSKNCSDLATDPIFVQKVRNDKLATTDLATATPEQLQHLVAIDRHVTRARTRRRRPFARLEAPASFLQNEPNFLNQNQWLG
jgi:hypothetical protein